MLPTSSAFRSNVSAAMVAPPVGGQDTTGHDRGTSRLRRDAPNVWGYGGHFGAPHLNNRPFRGPHLNNRPRVTVPATLGRKTAGLSQPPRPRDERVTFLLVQELRKHGGRSLLHEPSQVVTHTVGQRPAGKIPDHRPQLGLDVETEPVVDGPDAAVGPEQAVAALAVGVVGDQIEGADPGELIAVRGLLTEREVVLREVRGHELLQRALAVGPVAPHREGHEPPAERLREVIRGQLALEEAGRKIPERALATLRLVDGERAGALERDLDEERRVAASGQPPLEGHLAAREERGEIRR